MHLFCVVHYLRFRSPNYLRGICIYLACDSEYVTSVFKEKETVPNESMVSTALGRTYEMWKEFRDRMCNEYTDVKGEWKNYGKAAGWSYQLKSKGRTMFYFVPNDGYFSITFVFGDRAAEAAENSDVPEEIKEKIRVAKRYAEGRSVSMDVRNPQNIATAKILVMIKDKF